MEQLQNSTNNNKENKSYFGTYSGKEFLELEIEKRHFIVENLIRERDSVILVGDPKSGKSLLIQQLICSLTAGVPFLSRYEVLKPCKVTYIQLEGELGDSQDRFKRMMATLEHESDNFQILYSAPLNLQNSQNISDFLKSLKGFNPDILIIDACYFAFRGSMSDDKVVREFLGNLRVIKDALGCAIIVVTHTHKGRLNLQGGKIDERDEAIFGSQFFRAWADTLLLLTYSLRTGLRTLSCDTQRSGDIEKVCSLKLNQPNPLYFEVYDETPKVDIRLEQLFKDSPNRCFTIKDIEDKLKIGRRTVYTYLTPLIASKVVEKNDNIRPVEYYLRKP